MQILGTIVLILVLALVALTGCGITVNLGSQQQPTDTQLVDSSSQPAGQAEQPANPAPPQDQGDTQQPKPAPQLPPSGVVGNKQFTTRMAAKLCERSGCSPKQFLPLVEGFGKGPVNPRGKKFNGPDCNYTFVLPEQVMMDYTSATTVEHGVWGPITITQVCGASVRDFR